MTDSQKPSLMILVAGPYRSGTGDDPVKIAANVKAMTDMALRLVRRQKKWDTKGELLRDTLAPKFRTD